MRQVLKFKSTTNNGRHATTRVFKPHSEVIVINQRVLALKSDIDNGWFQNSKTIREFKDLVLREVEIVFWCESFDLVVNMVEALNALYPSKNINN